MISRGDRTVENEVARILALPTLEPTPVDPGYMTQELRRPGGNWNLRPIQSLALSVLAANRGLFAPIRVGGGKTLISHLAPVVLGAKVGLVFTTAPNVEPSTRAFHRDCVPNFRTVPVVVRSYDSLSTAGSTDYLERFADRFGDAFCIVTDECHKLRNLDAARTKRMGRFLLAHPGVTFAALTGSVTKHGLHDFAHLAEWALGRASPVPRPHHAAILDAWAQAIDSDGRPGPREWQAVAPLVAWAGPERGTDTETKRTVARRALARRIRSAPGVVTSVDGDGHDGALEIRVRPVEMPSAVEEAIRVVKTTDVKPNGDVVTDDLDAARTARQLAAGFYYLWQWPDGKPDTAWLEARSRWHRHVRAELSSNSVEGYDSPFLVAGKIAREAEVGVRSAMHEAWRAWDGQRHKRWFGEKTPPTVPVWIDAFLVADAIRWANEQEHRKEPGIVWYKHRAVEELLVASGMPVYGAGSRIDEDRPHVCAASIRSHGTGRNLQKWHRSLVLEPPADGEGWEQLVGRQHREGQTDDVLYEVYAHCDAYKDALAKGRRDADYVEETFYDQKLQKAVFA